jgi:hypothetical protein
MCAQSQPVRGLLSSILPKGRGLVFMLKFYADESVDSKSSLMIMSGYLMTEDQFVALDEAVQAAREDLPYFHMKEGHSTEHPAIYQRLVGLTNPNSVICGISCSLYIEEHEFLMRHKAHGQKLSYWMGKPYTYLLGQVMALCSERVSQTKYRDELIAYVFENGHANQGDANAFWGQLSHPKLVASKKHYRYASHTFVDGKGPLGSVLQLCDILAWNFTKFHRQRKPTPELDRLLETPLAWSHHGPAEIRNEILRGVENWKKITQIRSERTKRLHG